MGREAQTSESFGKALAGICVFDFLGNLGISMQSPTSLAEIRNTITRRRRARFIYERHTTVVADLYLLGHARRTAAYIVVAWCITPDWGWRVLRYSEMRDFETMGPVDLLRGDSDPYDKGILTIDTQMPGLLAARRS